MLFFYERAVSRVGYKHQRVCTAKKNALQPLNKNSVWNKWRDVSLEEMKAFIGIIINKGLHDVPDMKDFFSQQWECYISFFSDIMSRMRFFADMMDISYRKA